MYQKIILIGRLGRDPEMRYTPGGTAVTSFSLATTSKLSKTSNPECPNGWKETYDGKSWELTTWWRITAWRGLAETCNQFLSKGRQIYVEGTINGEALDGKQNPRIWTGQDGVPRASYEITARVIKFLGGRGDVSAEGGDIDEPPADFVEENEIPF